MTLVASSEGNDEFQIELSQPPIIPPRRDEEISQKQQQQRGSRPRKKSSERNKRHGARNQHRHKFFIKWLLKTFNIKEGQSESSQQQHILDVAGGKGEVSARLTMCHRQQVIMVDPRTADIVDCFERIVLPKIPNKWQARLEEKRSTNPDFIKDTIKSRFQQLVTTFDEYKFNNSIINNNSNKIDDEEIISLELRNAIEDSSLIIGLHADGATEAIVDAALKYNKPFVVVPCCVFPSFFPSRTILVESKTVPVRTHEQFCLFLLRKDPRFVMEELPFDGRNIAIWWDGK